MNLFILYKISKYYVLQKPHPNSPIAIYGNGAWNSTIFARSAVYEPFRPGPPETQQLSLGIEVGVLGKEVLGVEVSVLGVEIGALEIKVEMSDEETLACIAYIYVPR
ncbi:11389_t:CDS:2 [Racocetra fulgida]|uniref:11389_t:CDS:1 n=1 Tax=Racocetra fulgida TaxID=60492 RepID=A0A9N9C4M9_9GLOM|nr:11389_t:CDS:2 [Racocetra fulgida]